MATWRLALILLVGAALPARAGDPKARKYFYEDILEPFFALDVSSRVYRSQRPGSEPSAFAVHKPSGTLRVFLIGGSIARMFSGPGSLQDLLRSALPSRRVEVVNCGMSGYDLAREALIEREVLDLEPDLIVLMTGHNESLGSAPQPLWRLRLRDSLEQWRAFKALAESLSPPQPDERARAALVEKRLAEFEAGLRAGLRSARERGVPVAVLVPPLNYRDAPADPEESDEGFDRAWLSFLKGECPETRPSGRPALFLAARCRERLGRGEEARALYEAAMKADPGAAGRCEGRCQTALRSAAAAEDAPLADADAVFRRFAQPALPGLAHFHDRVHWKPALSPLVSLTIIDALRASPPSASWPWDEAALAAARRGLERPRPDDSRATLQYAFAAISEGEPSSLSLRGLTYLDAVFQAQPGLFADSAALAASVLKDAQGRGAAWGMPPIRLRPGRLSRHLGELRLLRREYPRAARELLASLEADPSLGRVWVSLAAARALSGDRALAAVSLKEALRSDGSAEPGLIDAVLAAADVFSVPLESLGLRGVDARTAGGRTERALALYEKAAQGAPRDARLRLKLARLALAAGDRPRALAALAEAERVGRGETFEHAAALAYLDAGLWDQALRLLGALTRRAPKNAVYLKDRGVCEYRRGALERAELDLKEAVRLDPSLAEAALSLGELYTAARRRADALAVYDAALALSAPDGPLRPLLQESRDAAAK